MSARRDPEGRLPQGGGLAIALVLSGMLWAGIAAVIVVSVLRPAPLILPEVSQGESHADR